MSIKSVIGLLGLVLSACCFAAVGDAAFLMQESAATGPDGKPVDLYDDPGNTYKFNLSDGSYSITDSGIGTQTSSNGSSRKFKLHVPSDMWIGGPVYFAPYDGDYLILYGVSDGENGGANFDRIDGKTLSVKWSEGNIPFNMTPGLIKDDRAYVTGIGFIGSINLDTGRYAWCIDNLYQGNNIFDAFEVPTVEGGTFSVRDKLKLAKDGTPYYVKVDWKDSKVETNAPLAKPALFLSGCRKRGQ